MSESGIFDTYEREYATLYDGIRAKLVSEIGAAATAESRKRVVNQTKRELEEADEIISQMEMELVSLPGTVRARLAPRVKAFKDEMKTAKKDLASHELSDRDQLLGRAGSSSGSHLVDVDARGDRARILNATERLQDGSRKLDDAKRMALETEGVAIETLGNLNQQREQILRTRDRLTVADGFITKSQGVLKGMQQTMMANKWLTYGIIGALILLIIIVIYFKWIAQPSK
ncbi:vesicle transport v-snare protein vti1 [Chytriomyces sp. MP71]|nr:vesicle transport v-snare protein vti1 [Chytriomyces sp. MP71]